MDTKNTTEKDNSLAEVAQQTNAYLERLHTGAVMVHIPQWPWAHRARFYHLRDYAVSSATGYALILTPRNH